MLWPRWGCSGGWAGHGQALRAVELMQLSRGRPISDRSSHHKLGEGKENSELRPGRVQASSLGAWRLALRMGSHALYVNTVAFQPLQKLSSRMSHSLHVGGSNTTFLVDQGTEFLGNCLRRCYFHNSGPQGLGEGGEQDLWGQLL